MIGISGQFVFGVTIGHHKDFLSLGDLQEFTVIEDAGGILPTYILVFKIYNDDILSFINDGNNLEVSFGQSVDSVTNMVLSIFSHNVQPQGNNCKTVTLIGLLHKPDFLTTAKLVNYDAKLSTIEVIKMVAERNFRVVSNVTRSYDPHLNIQPNTTDKEFITKIYPHTDLGESFPVMGINIRGEFIIHDFRRLVKEGFTWKIGMDRDAIGIAPDYVTSSNSGFVDAQYSRRSNTVDMVGGFSTNFLGSVTPLLTLMKSLTKTNVPAIRGIVGLKGPSIPGFKIAMPSFVNANVSAKYETAALNNVKRLASFSSSKITVTLMPQEYIPISVLDIVMFKQPHTNRQGSSESESGLYIVTKVARTIQNSMLLTTVQMSREGMNSEQGNTI